MKVYPDCYPCFFTQILKTSRMLALDEEDVRHIVKRFSSYLANVTGDESPAGIGREIYKIISDFTRNPDPYKEIKDMCTQKALALYPELKALAQTAMDPLLEALRIAVAGNVIDFGTTSDVDIKSDVKKVLDQDFVRNDYEDFCLALDTAKNILFLGDNAGETVFDRVLIEELPQPVRYVVRESPMLNDAVREDAEAAGLNEVVEIISSGCDAPGTLPHLCSAEFMDILRSADLIISKGQGNYEGLSGENLPIFFLLKAKCSSVAQDLGVPVGSILFFHQQ